MKGRTYSAQSSYRYGFNGKENDNEVKGEGNQQDYGMRIYDPRLGKFLSVDPLIQKYPYYTPYQFSGNTPIQATDLDGAEPDYKGGKEAQVRTTTTEHNTSSGIGYGSSYKTTDTWYWHSGGIYKSKTQDEKTHQTINHYSRSGWYSEKDYKELLKAGPNGGFAGQVAGYLGLFSNGSAGHNFTDDERANFANTSVGQFISKLSDQGVYQLTAAAKEYASGRNSYVTGYTAPSSFNVEDMIGLGLLIKGAAKSILGASAKTATNTIYRVVSKGEAADVLEFGFRQAPINSRISSYEGKLFWTNMKDARWYQNWAGKSNQILKVKVDKGFIFENGTDVGRQFFFVSPERLNQFNSAIKSVK